MKCDRCGKAMRVARPVLNPEKDHSAAHAFDPNRVLPRPLYDPPWGEHPDDDMFLTHCADCHTYVFSVEAAPGSNASTDYARSTRETR